jgi:hypothetical protein
MCTSMYCGFLAALRVAFRTAISASDDLQNPDKIRSLLKDLREARQAKCRDGLSKIDHNELSVRLRLTLGF